MLIFEPVRHARVFWPQWTFHMGRLDDGETHAIYPQSKTVFINPVGISPLVAIAHVVGHLELRHHLTPGDLLTDEQCVEAALWANLSVEPEHAMQWPRWNYAEVA